MIRVVFFAQLREQLGVDEVELPAARVATVAQVREALMAEQPAWRPHLERDDLLGAVNQTMAKSTTAVADGDEVAFFPPVTGG